MYIRVLRPFGLVSTIACMQSVQFDDRPRRFHDRQSAGRELAQALQRLNLSGELLVLGVPRGGVPVAFEVAQALAAPLDVLVVRKIGAPSQPELAIGAIASGGIVVHEPEAVSYLAISESLFQRLLQHERVELERRERAYRGGRPPLHLQRRTVILVDDGLATGATMLAAVRAAQAAGAALVIVAAPVASKEAVALLRPAADQILVLQTPPYFFAVGEWYEHFEQTSDDEVQALLKESHVQHSAAL
jgi:predicted phosphoribosyltransferase